jgi:GntR family transcriptional repressor for pyruvate dehydrogenase complex
MAPGAVASSIERVGRKSLVDSVVDAMTARILRGEIAPGEALPSEQELAARLGVSRTAVREALNRLATSQLISIRHSGGKHVLDYRQSAGLELLATLLVTASGEIDPAVVGSVMEMRSALAPDIARLAALRRTTAHLQRIEATLAAMAPAAGDLERLQDLVTDFWDHLVDASANIAYRLAYNSLRVSYEQSKQLLTRLLAEETTAAAAYSGLAAAVARGDAAAAESMARDLVRRGEGAVKELLAGLSGEGRSPVRDLKGPRVRGSKGSRSENWSNET